MWASTSTTTSTMRSLAATLLLTTSALVTGVAADEPLLYSSSLNTCQDNSGFTARLFNFVFTPNNGSVSANIVAVSSITGKVIFDVAISAYGYEFFRRTIDPCDPDSDLAGLCPMRAGNLVLPFNIGQLDKDTTSQIPGIAYTFPDLDATARIYINMTEGDEAGHSVACVEANISNGKTINLAGVKWATAGVAFLALAASALISGLGHANAASHVAVGAVSLFGYFQAQAMLGLTGIRLPPVARAWTQDFQWSMGIIKLNFMQSIFTWYQRATGGTPSTLFDTLTTTSVQVEKRSLDGPLTVDSRPNNLFSRALAMSPKPLSATASALKKRANIQTGSGSYVVYGIQRVAFASGIESTNLFMTAITFFCIFVVFTALLVLIFRLCCGVFAKRDAFLEFRNGWRTVLKGVLYRVCLIGFPIVSIFCLWELTQRDSAAEVVLAVFFFFGTLFLLGYAAFKIIMIARRSINLHRNPAYILFSDPQTLNKWGFLYVPYRASGYYWFAPVLGHVLIKSMFIALAQDNGTLQAVALIIIEAAALIAASVLRPWMDKSTNSFNIAIYAINFVNAVFLLIFTDVFDQPPLVTGVIGVVLWILNNVFALILLLMLIITTTIIFFKRNPDSRYQYMLDDRTSFIKSRDNLGNNPELAALAVTARGAKGGVDLDDDDYESGPDGRGRRIYEKPSMSSASASYRDRHSSPAPFQDATDDVAEDHRKYQVSPSPLRDSGSYSDPSLASNSSRPQHQPQPQPPHHHADNNASPWQRGAGYENGQ